MNRFLETPMQMLRPAFVASLLLVTSAFAQTVPTRLSFTARLVDNGTPVQGPRDFVFKLYPVDVMGNEVWAETRNAVPVTDGTVNLELGANSPLTETIFDGQTLYLEVTVGMTVLSPRTPVVSVPYALRSNVAAQVGTLTPALIQRRVGTGCGAGAAIQVINADGTVVCAATGGANDAGMTTITNITAGAGLTGGGATGNVTLGVAFGGAGGGNGSANTVSRSDHNHFGTYLPLGPVLACTGSDKVVGLAASGSVICAADTNTTYSAGSGLSLSGANQFSLQSCPATQVLVAGAGGTWSCASPAVGVASVTATANGGVLIGGTASNPTVGLPSACGNGQVMKFNGTAWSCQNEAAEVHLGDVVSVGGAANGGVVIGGTAANPTVGLPSACSNGQVMKFNGTGWSCQNEAPEVHLGDVLTVGSTSGGGLQTGGTGTNPTLGLTTCSTGQVMKFGTGGWACAADGDTDTVSSSLNPFGSPAVAFTEPGWRIEITPSPYNVQVTWLGGFVSYNVDNGDGAPVFGLASAAGSFGKVATIGRVVRLDVSSNTTGAGTWFHYECRNVFSSIFECRRHVY